MKRSHIILAVLIGVPILLSILYYSIFRTYTEEAYHNEAPGWFDSIINWFYPRFEAEKSRFSLQFFLNKTDQMILRMWIVFGGLALLYDVTNYRSSSLKNRWDKYWSVSVTREYVTLLRTVFCVLLLITTYDWWYDFYRIESIAPFYKPILIYKLFKLPLPNTIVLEVMYGLMVVGAILTIFNYKPKTTLTLTIVLFIYLQGLYYCFEKMDHGYVTFTYGGVCLLMLIFTYNAKHKEVPKWPITLAQTLIALIYFQAGLEKLLISNFNWASDATMQSYLLAHPTKAGLWLAESDLLCQVLSWTTLLMQITFPIILFKPKLKWIYLSWGILFHLGTTFLMGISSYLNPWIFAYIFFIDWSLLPKYSILKKNLSRVNNQA